MGLLRRIPPTQGAILRSKRLIHVDSSATCKQFRVILPLTGTAITAEIPLLKSNDLQDLVARKQQCSGGLENTPSLPGISHSV